MGRRVARRLHRFRTEAEMCDVVAAWARRDGARVHPECGGWDMLIEAESGEKVGVQAKIRPGLDVVSQVVRSLRPPSGTPDVVAVLVPTYHRELSVVLEELGYGLMSALSVEGGHSRGTFAWWLRFAPRMLVERPCWVPEVEVAFRAGVPSPRTVTPRKLGTARLCARLRLGETPTRSEFAQEGVRVDHWTRDGLVVRVPGTRPARYALADASKLYDRNYPEVAEALGLPDPRGGTP